MGESEHEQSTFSARLELEAGRLALAVPDTERAEMMPRYREFLTFGMEAVRQRHAAGGGGREVARMRSETIDVLIRALLDRTHADWLRQHGSAQSPLALLALGGYGRGELCPLSDVDLMFLYPAKVKRRDFAEQQAFYNDSMLYPLWDLGLKVGHSTRTERDAIAEAAADVQSKNAMLEARFLAGDARLARHFATAYSRFIRRENLVAYVEARLVDQRRRRSKYGDTVFLQEPDIKNGVGGLRDYQNILWIVRLKLNRSVEEPVPLDRLLPKNEHEAFEQAYDFLLRVRNELHFRSRRPTDLLDLERQPHVAEGLGWAESDVFVRIEKFMRAYYRAAKSIFETSHFLEQHLARQARTRVTFAAVIESRRAGWRPRRADVFSIGPYGLDADHELVFKEDPVRLIRVFRIRQQFQTQLSLEHSRLVISELDRIDGTLRASAEANRAFRSILQARGEVADNLRAMHRTGVLGAFLPEWAELDCLVQHEYYHRYTADEHTLATISHLDRIFRGDEPELTGKYREELEKTELPALLYVVLLLHDIGKGRGIQGHAEVGAGMAGKILRRLGVAEGVRERILFLIRGHLEMARFWQHYDIDDPRTVRKFARWVGDVETLRYLYVLTFCDARGTADQLWNSYKDSLHTQLHRATVEELGESTHSTFNTMISKEALIERVPGLSIEEIEAHYNLLPERYFVYSDLDEVAQHVQMVHRLLRNIAEADSLGSLVPVVEWSEDADLGLTVVHIVTWDRAGLFYKLAGAFSVAGLSIVSSKALTRADHITIDTFYVAAADGGVVRDSEVKAKFVEALEEVLLRNKELLPEITARARERKRSAYLQVGDRLRAPLPPGVDVYHELSLRRTIIEVQATDSIGLLYRLGRAIFDHGFDITFARISTERSVAVDTFYIEPINRAEDCNTDRLLSLRKALAEIVEEVSDAESRAG